MSQTILIVDDREPNRAYLTSLLGSRGYTTLEAVDGLDALETLRSTKADLVLADILMPRMDGYEFVRRLRQEQGLSSTPVILLTAHYLEAKARILAESFGVSFVITKPVEPSVILDSVSRALTGPQKATPHPSFKKDSVTSHLKSATYSDEHRRLLTDTLAYKAGQLEIANDRLRGLVSLGRRLASERSPRQLLSLFVSAAGDLVGADYVVIAVPDGDADPWAGTTISVINDTPSLSTQASAPNPQPSALRPRQSFRHIVANGSDPGVVGQVSSAGAVGELVKSFSELAGAISIDLDKSAVETALPEEFRNLRPGLVVAPITTASQRYGLIVFGGVGVGSEPADSIESLAQSMGAVLAVAYENAIRNEQIEHHAGRLQDEVAERRLAEERIGRLNAELEERVAQRTSELERSHERLRHSERMASLGTLCAGLGHDMGNLLLPIRVRLDLIEQQVSGAIELDSKTAITDGSGRDTSHPTPEVSTDTCIDHVKAIRECVQYIGDLTSGLRLLSLDADQNGSDREATHLREWWSRVQPLLRSALPARIELEAILPEDDFVVALPQPRLTQAVFNLIQNAGDAMRAIADGSSGALRVTVRIALHSGTIPKVVESGVDEGGGDWVMLSVTDNGPGMPEEVRSRALEPYFTTKSRGLSTGLGLSLVHGIVRGAGGRVDIDSVVGQGTTIRLLLPRASPQDRTSERRSSVLVSVSHPRLRATAVSMMETMGYRVSEAELDSANDAERRLPDEIWIAEAHVAPADRIKAFLESGAGRCVALIGDESAAATHPRCVRLGVTTKEVRSELRRHFASRSDSNASAKVSG